jgi:hypothetical protein
MAEDGQLGAGEGSICQAEGGLVLRQSTGKLPAPSSST